MAWALVAMYGFFAVVAGLNLGLMRHPRRQPSAGSLGRLIFLIPARNEAENLRRLIPTLFQGHAGGLRPEVFVFDDDSDDGTDAVASELGATVIRSNTALPAGWTGKNRACHELARAALSRSEAQWFVFLDADVYPKPGFAEGVLDLIDQVGQRCGVITGFPDIVPGKLPQPLFLAWVGWILLTTNPYGLVSRTGVGHNRFTNGQFHAWRRDVYERLMPNEAVRGAILEDVKMGRLCAQQGVPVEVANVSSILAVKMYDTWRETFDGMSKNSHEITGSTVGTLLLAGLMFFIAFGWLLAGTMWPIALAVFLASGVLCALTVRAKPWGIVLLPVAIAIGALTMIRSTIWHRTGSVVWKGRVYGGKAEDRGPKAKGQRPNGSNG